MSTPIKASYLVKLARLEFAEFLRTKRIEAKLSQMDVAKKLKLKNSQFISNIERGAAPVPFKVLKVLIELYNISHEQVAEKYLSLQKAVLAAKLSLVLDVTKFAS